MEAPYGNAVRPKLSVRKDGGRKRNAYQAERRIYCQVMTMTCKNSE